MSAPSHQQTLSAALKGYFRQYVENGPQELELREQLRKVAQRPVNEELYLRFVARYAYDEKYHQSNLRAEKTRQARAQTANHLWQLLGYLASTSLGSQQLIVKVDNAYAVASSMAIAEDLSFVEAPSWAAILQQVQFPEGRPPQNICGCFNNEHVMNAKAPIACDNQKPAHRCLVRVVYRLGEDKTKQIHALVRAWIANTTNPKQAGTSSGAAADTAHESADISSQLASGALRRSGKTTTHGRVKYWLDTSCWLLCGEGTLPESSQTAACIGTSAAEQGTVPAGPSDAPSLSPAYWTAITARHQSSQHQPPPDHPHPQDSGAHALDDMIASEFAEMTNNPQPANEHPEHQIDLPGWPDLLRDLFQHQPDDHTPINPHSPVIGLEHQTPVEPSVAKMRQALDNPTLAGGPQVGQNYVVPNSGQGRQRSSSLPTAAAPSVTPAPGTATGKQPPQPVVQPSRSHNTTAAPPTQRVASGTNKGGPNSARQVSTARIGVSNTAGRTQSAPEPRRLDLIEAVNTELPPPENKVQRTGRLPQATGSSRQASVRMQRSTSRAGSCEPSAGGISSPYRSAPKPQPRSVAGAQCSTSIVMILAFICFLQFIVILMLLMVILKSLSTTHL